MKFVFKDSTLKRDSSVQHLYILKKGSSYLRIVFLPNFVKGLEFATLFPYKEVVHYQKKHGGKIVQVKLEVME